MTLRGRTRGGRGGIAGGLLLVGCSQSSSAPPPAPVVVGPEVAVLSAAGLYTDIKSRTLVAGAFEYTPNFILWADGAKKNRVLVLPPGTTVDTTDPDAFRLPIGAKVFKEFDTEDGAPLETRLIEKRSELGTEADFRMVSFVWRADKSDADARPEGAPNVLGTQHDVPPTNGCWTCHIGEGGRVLGLSALQLSGTDALGKLAAEGRLSQPVNAPAPPVPGDAVAQKAMGYLHANCGNCHNPRGTAWPDTNLVLRISSQERAAADTALVKTSVGVALSTPRLVGVTLRITPGDPLASAVYTRMAARGSDAQMPPIATESADQAGLDSVAAWIKELK